MTVYQNLILFYLTLVNGLLVQANYDFYNNGGKLFGTPSQQLGNPYTTFAATSNDPTYNAQRFAQLAAMPGVYTTPNEQRQQTDFAAAFANLPSSSAASYYTTGQSPDNSYLATNSIEQLPPINANNLGSQDPVVLAQYVKYVESLQNNGNNANSKASYGQPSDPLSTSYASQIASATSAAASQYAQQAANQYSIRETKKSDVIGSAYIPNAGQQPSVPTTFTFPSTANGYSQISQPVDTSAFVNTPLTAEIQASKSATSYLSQPSVQTNYAAQSPYQTVSSPQQTASSPHQTVSSPQQTVLSQSGYPIESQPSSPHSTYQTALTSQSSGYEQPNNAQQQQTVYNGQQPSYPPASNYGVPSPQSSYSVNNPSPTPQTYPAYQSQQPQQGQTYSALSGHQPASQPQTQPQTQPQIQPQTQPQPAYPSPQQPSYPASQQPSNPSPYSYVPPVATSAPAYSGDYNKELAHSNYNPAPPPATYKYNYQNIPASLPSPVQTVVYPSNSYNGERITMPPRVATTPAPEIIFQERVSATQPPPVEEHSTYMVTAQQPDPLPRQPPQPIPQTDSYNLQETSNPSYPQESYAKSSYEEHKTVETAPEPESIYNPNEQKSIYPEVEDESNNFENDNKLSGPSTSYKKSNEIQTSNTDDIESQTSITALTQQIKRLPAVLYADSKDPSTTRIEHLLRDTYGLPLVTFYLDKIDDTKKVKENLHTLTASDGPQYLFICSTYIGTLQHIDNYNDNKQFPQLVEYVCGSDKKHRSKRQDTSISYPVFQFSKQN